MDRAVPLLLLPGVASVAERRMAGIPPEVTARGLVQMCFGDPSRVSPERLQEVVEELRERSDQPWADRALVRTMRGLMSSYLRVGRSAAWGAARRVRCPALVLWGDRDRLVDPRLAPRLAAAVPDSRLLVLEGVGHVAMLEAPEPTARAVLALIEDAGRAQDRSRRGPDHATSLAG
jgi:pimeloyl-ACP methyl ester carboxylesterase